MLNNNHARRVSQSDLPTTADAVQQYQQHGGRLTDPYHVGHDPLSGNSSRSQLRHQAFSDQYPSFGDIFSKLVNGDDTIFKLALKFYIDITHRIAST